MTIPILRSILEPQNQVRLRGAGQGPFDPKSLDLPGRIR